MTIAVHLGRKAAKQSKRIHLLTFKLTISGTLIIRVSYILEPDQDRHSIGPDLDPNCLQRLSADEKSRCEQGRS